MKFKYKILTKENLLIQKRSGLTTVEDLVSSVKKCQNSPDYKTSLDMLSDFRHVKFDFDLKYFDAFIKQYLSTNYLKSKFAIIVNNPENTALGIMYEYTKKQQYVKIFSTIKAACHWLNADYNLVKSFLEDEF